jgi:hypothetical protein
MGVVEELTENVTMVDGGTDAVATEVTFGC